MDRRPLLAALAILALIGVPASRSGAAQSETDPEALIRKALEAYRSEDAQRSIELLQAAIDRIQAESSTGLGARLPAVPEGWKADEPKVSSGVWGGGGQSVQWSTAERVYRKDDLVVRVSISNSPQLIQPQRAMLGMMSNEQYLKMMNADPERQIQPFERAGFTGWTTVEEGRNANAVALGDGVMIHVDVNRDRKEVLDRFLNGVDFKGATGGDR